MQKPCLGRNSLAGVACLTQIGLAAMIPGEALAAAPEKCAEPQSKDCEPLRPLAEDRLKESLKKTLPGELSPLLGANLPDLIISVRAQSSRLEPGDATDLQMLLQNIGSAPADFGDTGAPLLRLLMQAPAESVGGYIGEGGAGDGPEQVLEMASPRVIEPHERIEETNRLAIAGDSAPGVYRLCAIADPENAVRERNEENNRACVDVMVAVAPDDDSVAAKPRLEIPTKKILPRDKRPAPSLPAPERKDEE